MIDSNIYTQGEEPQLKNNCPFIIQCIATFTLVQYREIKNQHFITSNEVVIPIKNVISTTWDKSER